MKNKDDYIEKLEAGLKELSTKMGELKVKANLAKAEAKDEYNRQIEMLHAKQAEVNSKLKQLREAGEEAWQELKLGLDTAVEDIKDALKRAVEKVK